MSRDHTSKTSPKNGIGRYRVNEKRPPSPRTITKAKPLTVGHVHTMGTWSALLTVCFVGMVVASCTSHKVQVEAPEKPITINLNVKIDHEVRVKVEKDLEDVFSEDSKLF